MVAPFWHRVLVVLALLAAASAEAQPASPGASARARSKSIWQQGKAHYELGEFEAAIKAFKDAYALANEPVYLLSLGQAYRLNGDRKEAIFTYKQYLAARPNAPNRAEIEDWIAQLEKEIEDEEKKAAEERERRVAATSPRATTPDPAPDLEVSKAPPEEHKLRSGIHVGFSKLYFGTESASASPSAGLALSGSYEVYSKAVSIDVGALIAFTSAGYDSGGNSGSISQASLLATGALRFPLSKRVQLATVLGIGTMILTSLDQGNPWTNAGTSTTTFSFLAGRIGARFDYQASNRLVLWATPMALTLSPSALVIRGNDNELVDTVDVLARLDVLQIGAAYAF